jgi:hypothetical protein
MTTTVALYDVGGLGKEEPSFGVLFAVGLEQQVVKVMVLTHEMVGVQPVVKVVHWNAAAGSQAKQTSALASRFGAVQFKQRLCHFGFVLTTSGYL